MTAIPETRYVSTRQGDIAYQVLVTSTVKDLVIGSGIQFKDHGSHALKGVPDEWPLFALEG